MSSEELLELGLKQLNLEPNVQSLERLNLWLDLLNKWNSVHNLTSIKNREEQIKLHIFDALSALVCVQNAKIIADIGTGAGVPALIWAIFAAEKKFVLVESNKKKVAFLREVKRRLNLVNVEILGLRLEEIKPIANLDLIVSRAVASSKDFLKMVDFLVIPQKTRVALMKAKQEENFDFKNYSQRAIYQLNVPFLEAQRFWIEFEKGNLC